MKKIKEIIEAFKVLTTINKFLKQQEDAKKKIVIFIEKVKDIREAFLDAVAVVDEVIAKLKAEVNK